MAIDVVSDVCKQQEETYEHLFLSCTVSSMVWWHGPWPMRTDGFSRSSITDWLQFLLDARNLPQSDQDRWPSLMLAVAITLDSLWWVRNQVVH